ncbi:hypothetical protein GCM10027449_12890 [Sinomonas notoginsengisoli]
MSGRLATADAGGMTAPRRILMLVILCGVLALSALAAGSAGPASAQSSSAERPPGHGWTWPLEPRPAVVRPFDAPKRPWLSGHRGVDLDAEPGSPVLSPQAGTVVFSGWVVDRPVVTVDHENGLRSSFEPVSALLPVGAAATKGEPIGSLAPPPLGADASHCGTARCLHWGVRRGEDYVDPLAFIEDRRPSVLLPWSGPP